MCDFPRSINFYFLWERRSAGSVPWKRKERENDKVRGDKRGGGIKDSLQGWSQMKKEWGHKEKACTFLLRFHPIYLLFLGSTGTFFLKRHMSTHECMGEQVYRKTLEIHFQHQVFSLFSRSQSVSRKTTWRFLFFFCWNANDKLNYISRTHRPFLWVANSQHLVINNPCWKEGRRQLLSLSTKWHTGWKTEGDRRGKSCNHSFHGP